MKQIIQLVAPDVTSGALFQDSLGGGTIVQKKSGATRRGAAPLRFRHAATVSTTVTVPSRFTYIAINAPSSPTGRFI
jgi:hypothetical protein